MAKQTSFNLDDDVRYWAIKYAQAHGLSMSRVMNRAFRSFWKHLPEKDREFVRLFEEPRSFVVEEEEPLELPPELSENDDEEEARAA